MSGQQQAWFLDHGDRQVRFASSPGAHLFADSARVGTCTSMMQPTWRVVFGLEGGIEVVPGGGEPVCGLVIPPDFPNTSFSSAGYITLFIDPWEVARDVPAEVTALDTRACHEVLAALGLESAADLDAGRRALRFLPGDSRSLDPRVRYAVANLTRFSRIEDLAHEVGLSAARLRVLVHAAVGIPLIRLRHWARVREAFAVLDQGLSAAAHEGGFVDQAHFTRVVRRLLDITPGSLIR